jgi:post-segregation antitoxin (ccd killing protein)
LASESITITVDKELKKKMKELGGVNWSKVARLAFEHEITKEKRKRATSDIKAIRESDRTSGWSGSEEVRKWRDLGRRNK